ncbi:endonuclease/exonuclease/phosphatase family protein [Amycolatopsis thailandensis]|uniref:endonuclease/exonuclease/phosphatase family protein n=1 Tax=Amycolatopsis thailandensis TaxID=589330 RepID=UPI0036544FEA
MSRTRETLVLTCNVQRASVSRARRQAAWLVDSGADVLVLTEVSAGESGDELAKLLADDGFGVALPKPSENDRYRVLVAGRGVELTGVDVGAGSMGHRCVAARAALPAGEIGVLGLYVPSRGPAARRNQDKRAFQERVMTVLPTVEAVLDVPGPVVISGDLNVVEPAHDPRYAVFGEWEYDFYRAFGRAGFDDAFRIKEPTAMDYSWFGRPSANGERNGYRFDHTFVSRAHRTAVLACRYDHSVRTDGLTDHSAMTLALDLTRAVA